MKHINKLIFAFFILASSVANSSVIGDSVDMSRVWGSTHLDATTAIIGAGNEWGFTYGIADIFDGGIDITFSQTFGYGYSSGGVVQHLLFDGFDFGGDPLASFSAASYTLSGVESSDSNYLIDSLTYGNDWLRLDVGGWGLSAGDTVSILFETTIDGATVPEPSIIALMGLGLAGLSFARRRKQQA